MRRGRIHRMIRSQKSSRLFIYRPDGILADFRQFRVIVVQRTDERHENLLKQLNKEYNHRMFWLTTEAHYKVSIGADIFRCASPKFHSGSARTYFLNLEVTLEGLLELEKEYSGD